MLEETATLILDSPGASISVVSVSLTDNGDNDGFADPNETVSMFVTLRNNSDGQAHDNVVLRLASNDPNVDCILGPVLAFGTLAAHETRKSTAAFTFRVADVSRASVDADLSAAFVRGDQRRRLRRHRAAADGRRVDLDLNVSGGLLPTTYTEGFEGAGFGSFTTMALDAGKGSLALSDGHRCQYNDPDFANSNSYGNTFCFLGDPPGTTGTCTASPRPTAAAPTWATTPCTGACTPARPRRTPRACEQLDAIRTTNTVNLGWNGVTSELSFKHQVGLAELRLRQRPPMASTVDRGIVQVQLANSAGTAIGNWRKISPYENLYDSQTMDNYTNCLFDPTDDGNDEDDYFDPNDPNRRLGPSSTCAPEFAFARQGEIFCQRHVRCPRPSTTPATARPRRACAGPGPGWSPSSAWTAGAAGASASGSSPPRSRSPPPSPCSRPWTGTPPQATTAGTSTTSV